MARASTPTSASERQALVTALQEKGPEADTLCEGWNTHDLAVHVVARDARPDLVFGQDLPLVGDAARAGYQKYEQLSFSELVDRIDAGVPAWHPAQARPVDEALNTVEFLVHTEDVLRAGPEADSRPRRDIPAEVRQKVWDQASRTVFLGAARTRRQRITYLSPGYGSVTHGRSGEPMIVIEGAPEELVLWAFGRDEVAEVQIRTV